MDFLHVIHLWGDANLSHTKLGQQTLVCSFQNLVCSFSLTSTPRKNLVWLELVQSIVVPDHPKRVADQDRPVNVTPQDHLRKLLFHLLAFNLFMIICPQQLLYWIFFSLLLQFFPFNCWWVLDSFFQLIHHFLPSSLQNLVRLLQLCFFLWKVGIRLRLSIGDRLFSKAYARHIIEL